MEQKEQKERKARGQFCGYYGTRPVYYEKPHFLMASSENRDFLGFLSIKEAKRVGLRETGHSNSALLYGANGYIGPSRRRENPTE